jgi:hypothetical protein
VPDPETIEVELTQDERALLRCGLLEWHGPARPTEAWAVALGFGSLDEMSRETLRLRKALAGFQPLTRVEWQQALICTEVVFASDVVGSGLDWRITTGFSDEATIGLLRGLQRKLPRWRG